MKKKDKIRILENKIEELKEVLNQINRIICTEGANFGSDDYFKIRGLCVDTIRETDLRFVEVWEDEK